MFGWWSFLKAANKFFLLIYISGKLYTDNFFFDMCYKVFCFWLVLFFFKYLTMERFPINLDLSCQYFLYFSFRVENWSLQYLTILFKSIHFPKEFQMVYWLASPQMQIMWSLIVMVQKSLLDLGKALWYQKRK